MEPLLLAIGRHTYLCEVQGKPEAFACVGLELQHAPQAREGQVHYTEPKLEEG